MILLLIILATTFLLFSWIGFKQLIQLRHLSKNVIIYGCLGIAILFTLLATGQWTEVITPELASRFTMTLYTAIGGFFFGFAVKMGVLRSQKQEIVYVYRSFWTSSAPNLIATILIFLGLLRTNLISADPVSGIAITSGISLICFGVLGFFVRIVPEFRADGILILDNFVAWKKVVAYEWETETSLTIEYYGNGTGEKLTQFSTYIPSEDRSMVSKLLNTKLKDQQSKADKKSRDVELQK